MSDRCKWCNTANPLYIEYHDKEWGQPNFDDKYLFEMLILESFQAGLSWECVLNKRENFRKAFDNFDIEKIINYDDQKITDLCQNEGLIRNKLKIKATITNAKIFRQIQSGFGSFANYLRKFCGEKTYFEIGLTHSPLSDIISSDLKKYGMKFVGSTIIYAYLQAIGIIYSHDKNCFLYREK